MEQMVYVVMGVAGSGKTTVGSLLASRLGLPFYDGDQYHLPSNMDRMKNGIPLGDDDRMEWLERLADLIGGWNKSSGAVLACSALKESYRRTLSGDGSACVTFIYLKGGRETIFNRMSRREGHFFPPDLLDSQFAALEEPQHTMEFSIEMTPEEICAEIEAFIKDNRQGVQDRSAEQH
jgi:6-phosphogluconate dehydrogenase